ncbi:MAG: glycosyltransferase family 2 protein [Candidatus Sericytochromatia bacterium]
MTTPSLDVLISTSPGREDNLRACLEMLCRQSDRDFRVFVSDDGSRGGEQQVAEFATRLEITYHWRPNDLCVSRSRNLAAAGSRAEHLVLIDSDVLLNPAAISAYRAHFAAAPQHMVIGYMGNQPDRVAPSYWLPERRVHYIDKRLQIYGRTRLEMRSDFYTCTYRLGWSGNLGVSREAYRAVGGFDERYRGWGGEDAQFCFDLHKRGYRFAFSLDVWGEHQQHTRQERFHRLEKAGKRYTIPDENVGYRPEVLSHPDQRRGFLKAIFDHHIPQDPDWDPILHWQLQYPGACFGTG